LLDELRIYRDDGSGAFEPGTDALVTAIAPLSLTRGIQAIDLPEADEVQISPGATGRFFVVADVSPDAASQDPNVFRVRHMASHSEIVHVGTEVGLSQALGSGTQPVLVPEPCVAVQLGAGLLLLIWLVGRRGRRAP
jgi:hypothetical protein